MKKLSILLMFCALVMVAQAQKPKKPSISKAKSYLAKQELTEAVEMIELVINDAKLSTKPDAWSTRVKVYKAVYSSETPVAGVDKDQALELAVASKDKVAEVEGKGDAGPFIFAAEQDITNLYNEILNKGVELYNGGTYEEAIGYFETLPKLNDEDTVGYTYAAQVANEIEDWPTLVSNYQALGRMLKREEFYTTVLQIQKDVMEDLPGAEATIAEAKEVLGDDNNNINKYEIDLLILQDKIEDAKNKLIMAIEAEPELAVLRLRLALLYDQLASNERAKEESNAEKLAEYETAAGDAYAATLEVDPQNITALYNYSVVFNERANTLLKELEEMAGRSINEYQKNE